ncbi:MAG: hypothetical protein AAGE99_00230 [Chlamydiota bacterium]
MGILRGDLHLLLASFQPIIISKIAQAFVPTESLDLKAVALVDVNAVSALSQCTSLWQTVRNRISVASFLTAKDKLCYRSPKPLTQLATKRLSLAVLSHCPPLLMKLAFNAIDMKGRKKRTFYIISTVALGASMALYFLKTDPKTYDQSHLKRVAKHAVAQIVLQIAAVEISDWNDRTIAKEIDRLPWGWHQSLENYRDIGPKTKAAIDKKKPIDNISNLRTIEISVLKRKPLSTRKKRSII